MKPTSYHLNLNCSPLPMKGKSTSKFISDSSTYFYPPNKKGLDSIDSSESPNYRPYIITLTLINLIAISFVAGYIIYNIWLLDKSINQPFLEVEKSNSTLFQSIILFTWSGQSLFAKSSSPSVKSNSEQCSLSDESKFDCNPDEPINQERCEARGCCWIPASKSDLPPLSVPYCFYPKDYASYKFGDVEQGENNATIRLTRVRDSGFPKDIDNVEVQVIGLDDERLRIRLVDVNDANRFVVPMPFFNESRQTEIKSPLYKVKVNDNGVLSISRKSTGTEIFVTDLTKLIYSDQFIQLIVRVPSNSLYGLGEHKAPFKKDLTQWKRYTMFARDIGPKEDVNLYGSFPFYMMSENDDQINFHGVFLLNSNGMDVLTQPTPAVTWRTIGGILDFFLFLGPTPSEVTRQNINLVGKPVLQPYWAFGFHLCRYGYNSLNKTKEVMERNLAAGIPIEVQWNDIDYMDHYNDFTIDWQNFSGLGDFVKDLHARNMYYTMILDPGVSASEPSGTYKPFDEGIAEDIFIKNDDETIFVGQVWNPDSTAFPDFTNPKTNHYWLRQLKNLRENIEFDGIWIDMNEPSNFFDGQKVGGCPDSKYENPPYLPGGIVPRTKTICMTAKQHLGLHYNVHNLYGLYENVVTHAAAVKIYGKRPFIVSRSTFPSQGHFASHWSGDITSSWDHMRYTIPNMFEFNIYGTPMIGSDICGFNGNTTQQLCMRWSSLGAFYPFSRNHNDRTTIEQDPVALGEPVVAATKYALEQRYKLLPYLYGLFFQAYLNADTVVRPLFFEFPQDVNTYSIETAFLWGPWLYIVPVLEENTNDVTAYFPTGLWYTWEDSKLAFNSTGRNETLTIADDKIGLFVRGGGIIPIYKSSAMTTHELRKQKYHLNAYLDLSGNASGEIYHDDGQSLDAIESGRFVIGHCNASNAGLNCNFENPPEMKDFGIGGVTIIGLTNDPKKVTLNGTIPLNSRFNKESSSIQVDFLSDFNSLQQSFSINLNY